MERTEPLCIILMGDVVGAIASKRFVGNRRQKKKLLRTSYRRPNYEVAIKGKLRPRE